MWWETVHFNARPRETPDGRRTLGRNGGIWGPGSRWGHTCNAVKGGRYLYVFGGYGSNKCHTNEVHVFDTVKQTWSKPMMKGVPPSPRDSHTCTTVGNMLFIFGGTDGKSPLNDLHVLDTSSNTWLQPTVHGKGPDAREGHSAVLVDKRLFIFGGCGESSDTHKPLYYNDLYILDTEKLVWELAVTCGALPSARDCHSCSLWNNKIIVIAGEDSSDCYLSDVHILDAETLAWEKMSTTGILPHRAGHTSVAIGSNIFVFGGFTDARNLYDDLHVLDVDGRSWRRVVPVNQGPSSRFSVAGDCVDERRGIIVFIGGCNQTLEALDDMYYLHTDMPVVNGLLEPTQEKISIRRELKKKCQEEYHPAEGFVKDNGVLRVGTMSDSSRPVRLQDCSQAGTRACDSRPPEEVTFEATVTNSNPYGHAIETTIDGKLLHGMLFCCTSSFIQDKYPNKRMATGGGDARQNVYQPFMNADTAIHAETRSLEKGRRRGVYGRKSTSEELPRGTLASKLTKSTPVAVVQPYMTLINVEPPSLPHANQKNVGTPDDPQKPSDEKSCEKASASVEETLPSSASHVMDTEEHHRSSNGHHQESI
ncbi:tip elongation aberrant protein 1 [Phoenix dactylifera]|uniref:Tip elongation aberrant protein 1 n=1 Tax=Phoenix dactylifera TaxID=42345 RepID=A0A8B7BUG0_PHODC|nr:tip elongation aberrant protein 1 [Phoenix dactylifera]